MNFSVFLPTKFLEKAARLHIFPEDIVERFVRGGGAGGQKINKTSSTVWLKHLPTGLEVKCQQHRDREANRQSAYKLLILKIEAVVLGKESEEAKRIFKLRKQKKRRSRRAKEKMLEEKRRRGDLKAMRKKL